MFGYVTANKPELKIREFARYRGFYCGLCRRLHQNHGRLGQLTLTYDMTFLVLLLSSLYEPETAEHRKRCLIHPARKQFMLTNEITDYAADMNILLTHDHFRDDWEDEKKIPAFIGMKVLAGKKRRIIKKYPRQARAVEHALAELAERERENCHDIDAAAHPFGSLMAELFVFRHDEWEAALRKIGFFLGKFIYLMDSYEDVEKDIAAGTYNPFKEAYQKDSLFAENSRHLLTLMMAECSREFEKLPILLHVDILRNILYSGVWCRYTEVTSRR